MSSSGGDSLPDSCVLGVQVVVHKKKDRGIEKGVTVMWAMTHMTSMRLVNVSVEIREMVDTASVLFCGEI